MKVCVLTGKRGGFGAMRPMLRLMRDDPYFELDLVACDMHLSTEFGETWNEISEDFEFSTVGYSAHCQPRIEILGNISRDLDDHWSEDKPDLLMLYGDRGECLAAAMTATELCIPIAHLQGGDRSGTMDDRRRHSISALADLNFVSTEEAGIQVAKIAPRTNWICTVGDSHLDPIFEMDHLNRGETEAELGLDPKRPIIIVLHHPDPTDRIPGGQYIDNIMQAIDDPERQFVMIYPCSDPGWEEVVKALHWYNGHDNIQIHKNLPSRTFLGLMGIADCIVGNSSAGIIEAPYFDLPCVNVGKRQEGRLCSNNVVHSSHNVGDIERMFETVCKRRPPFKKLYGNGATGKRIINHLKDWNNG